MQIEITQTTVNERKGTKNGKDWAMRTQTGYAYILDETGKPKTYPESINIDLGPEQPAYAVGRYQLHDVSFFVGDYGKLQVGRLTLVPVAKA